MSNSTPIIVAGISAVGVVLTAFGAWHSARREFRLKRDLDIWPQFDKLLLIVDGQDKEGHPNNGLISQLGALHLIASLGRRHRLLREPARRVLEHVCLYDYESSPPSFELLAAHAARARVRVDRIRFAWSWVPFRKVRKYTLTSEDKALRATLKTLQSHQPESTGSPATPAPSAIS